MAKAGRWPSHRFNSLPRNPSAGMTAVPHSSRPFRDEWVSKPRSPLWLNFNCSSNALGVMAKAAPLVLLRRCHQASLHRVSVNVPDDFGAGCFTPYIAVKITSLPEPFAITFQSAGNGLLQGLQKLGQQDRWWLVDEQVDVLGHQDVSVDSGLMTCTNPFQNSLDCVLGVRCFKERETVKATECDEVKCLRLLEPLQTVRHASIVDCAAISFEDPLIAIRLR